LAHPFVAANWVPQLSLRPKYRPFFATPCYGGNATAPYTTSIIKLLSAKDMREQSDIEAMFWLPSGESLITRGRNYCVAEFLKTDATHLFFIDADIGFEPHHIGMLLSAEQDVIAGCYPIKEVNITKALEAKAAGRDPELHMSRLVIHPVDGFSSGRDGLIEVKECGTGFMCIRRAVIEKMIAAHPSILYESDDGTDTPMARIFHADIVDDVRPKTGIRYRRYLSEDYWFCREWRELGGRIYMHLGVVLTHTGFHIFKSSPEGIHTESLQTMQCKPQDAERVELTLAGKLDPKLTTPPKVVFDKQAREGAFAIWAKHTWPDAELHVYESDPDYRSMLMSNLQLCKVSCIVHEDPNLVLHADVVHDNGSVQVMQ
jgi:hypothetical protein